MPIDRTASPAARAHSIARRGESNVARNPSPSRVDLLSPKPIQRGAQDAVVTLEKLTPVPIASPSGPIRRPDDVGEQNRCQDAIEAGKRTSAGQEGLDFVSDLIDIPTMDRGIAARRFNEPGVWQCARQCPRVRHREELVLRSVEDENRRFDPGEAITGIDRRHHPPERVRGDTAAGGAVVTPEPELEDRVMASVRRDDGELSLGVHLLSRLEEAPKGFGLETVVVGVRSGPPGGGLEDDDRSSPLWMIGGEGQRQCSSVIAPKVPPARTPPHP